MSKHELRMMIERYLGTLPDGWWEDAVRRFEYHLERAGNDLLPAVVKVLEELEERWGVPKDWH